MFRQYFLGYSVGKLGVWGWGIIFLMAMNARMGWSQTGVDSSLDNAKILKEIDAVLKAQAQCWNDKDIEGFMQTYWNSEHLTFSGGGKTTRGWRATLERYQARYPADKMGSLHFDNQEITLLSDSAAMVLGFWHLDQGGKKSDGNFTLVMRKIDGAWKIIHDHSSTEVKSP